MNKILSIEELNRILEEKRKFFREHPEELERLRKHGEELRNKKAWESVGVV